MVSTPDWASSMAIQHQLLSSPFLHKAVLGWRPLRYTHDTNMSQRAQRGCGRFAFSVITMVSRMLMCTKCTQRFARIVSLPRHISTGHAINLDAFRKYTRLVPAQGVNFFYMRSNFSALQICALILSTNLKFIFTLKYCTTQFIHCVVQYLSVKINFRLAERINAHI